MRFFFLLQHTYHYTTKTKVVLTTAYTDYALDGFENDVTDYLLKPITFERFLSSIAKARSRINVQDTIDYIFVKTEYRMQKVTLSNIQYIEGLGDYITLHTTTEKLLCLERIKHMNEMLGDSFLRVHKSYLINIAHIDFIEKGRIVIGKAYLPIGDSYKDSVRKKLKL